MEFLITFLLIFIGIIWLFGKIFPRLLAWYIKRKIVQMGGTAAAQRMNEEEILNRKAQEGKVTVIRSEQPEKVIERNMGEYVEYEEEK